MFHKLFRIALVITLVFSWPVIPVTASPQAGPIWFVKPDGSGDCSDWAHACGLQTALAGVTTGDEIWVAAGVYTPGTARSDTFLLVEDVAVYGGFLGVEESREARNPAANLTILSGDKDHDDSQTPILTNPATVTGNMNNNYHVVTGANGATLDGFTITAGNANGLMPDNGGGGIIILDANVQLTDLVFIGNRSLNSGGGLFIHGSDSP